MKNQNPIHVFATWKVKEGNIENILEILKTVSAESIKEEGNLFYKIHQGNTDSNTIVLFEGYANEAALDEHRNSAHYKDLVVGQLIPLLESREVILTSPIDA
ncbi:putative quinol monooxygenase [Pedobacter sp. Leaf176]|uniref:putative quinol monooxygenase n=1 Tax=Pedobacter sp. Leaf176 TaxID=1736286 RepID=UPI0006F8B2E9|nr:putative quinol monooxygenase [Pedobacter sp. Leaf176]KQR70715.1 antibiotic biosynthesis monooxygenase [Pedobacter sp. Leaf176]